MSTFAIDIRLIGKKRTGDETVFFHLIRELLRLDMRNLYFLLSDITDPQKLADIQERLGCAGQKNVRMISLFGKNRFIWNLFSVPWFLMQNHIDVYHTQYILPAFVPRRTRAVTHIHDVSFCAYPEHIGWSDRLFLSLLIPSSLRRAALIIAVSEFTKSEIQKYYHVSSEKITVIPNALGENFSMVPDDETKRRIREKYHLPEMFLLSVGTLQPRKNIPFLIDAVARLRKRLPNLSLVIVGSRTAHHFDRRIDERVVATGLKRAIVFPGYVENEDLPALVSLATVFVFPSLYEGFGIPLLEAMSQDVPIAASDIPCFREIGANALSYFNPTDLASCVDTLYTLCIDEKSRNALQERGRERLSQYSWRTSAKFLFDVYTGLSH